MNCLSVNIQGIGVSGKATWIKRLKNEFGVSFIGMQETMSTNLQPGMLSHFWGGMGYDCEIVNSNGHSGGLVCLWDPKKYTKDVVEKDDNYLHISGLLTDGLVRLNIINVYAPQHNEEKRNLWEKILQVMQSGQGWWVVFGDFNTVRNTDERKISKFDPVCARDFNNFIDEADLREYNLKGPKPFRWFDSWFERSGCEDVVKSVLVGNNMNGPSDLNLSNKLKSFRDKLKMWYKTCKLKEDEAEQRLRKERDGIEILMEQKDLEESELWVWSECKKSLEEIQLFRSRDIRQKSRVK
ncbi:uncharacterized protein LOC110913477 [Helianthus annuus]|uniref:uncharacterized protein LOC110913477 n=1 Tax=Helianthus annuus TaxID=4232 RepID=UPI000B90401F|nr:uncharacterized protein LOC110913477 [Helianthus annuus]